MATPGGCSPRTCRRWCPFGRRRSCAPEAKETRMEVCVRVPTQLRELVGGAASVKVGVGADGDRSTTVATVLDALAAQHPALERRVRDEQGRTRTHVNLFVDSDNVRDREGDLTPIRVGEELTILPAVSGG